MIFMFIRETQCRRGVRERYRTRARRGQSPNHRRQCGRRPNSRGRRLHQHAKIARKRSSNRQPTHINLVGSPFRGGPDGIVVRKVGMRDLFIPVDSEVVGHHCQYLGHRVFYTFHPTITVWEVGAGDSVRNPQPINRVRTLERNWSRLSGKMLGGHPQRGTYLFMTMLAVPPALSRCDFEHVESAAETISQK